MRLTNQPKGTAYQTISTPILWARGIDKDTLTKRFMRFARVKTLTSPIPLKDPSTQCLLPTRIKKKAMNFR